MNVGLLVVCCLDGQVLYTYDGQWQADLWSHTMRLLRKGTWWKVNSVVLLHQWHWFKGQTHATVSYWVSMPLWLFHGKNQRDRDAKTIGLMMMWITSRAEDKRHGTGGCVRCHKVQAVECRKEICSRTSFLQNEKPFGVVLFQQSFKFRCCNPFIAVNFNINGLFW